MRCLLGIEEEARNFEILTSSRTLKNIKLISSTCTSLLFDNMVAIAFSQYSFTENYAYFEVGEGEEIFPAPMDEDSEEVEVDIMNKDNDFGSLA